MRIFILLLICILFPSCSKDKEAEKEILELSCEEVFFTWEAGTQKIAIESNADCYISTPDVQWVSLEKEEASHNSYTLCVHVEKNVTEENRFCVIMVATRLQEKRIAVIQKTKEKLCFVGEKKRVIDGNAMTLSIEITKNIDYSVEILSDNKGWISPLSQNEIVDSSYNPFENFQHGNSLDLQILANGTDAEREALIIIYNRDYSLSDTLAIRQICGSNRFYDGETVLLQQASFPSPNLIVMGDGFTGETLGLNGQYESAMRQAMEYFFSIEPYTTYRSCFNVYMVMAESQNSGIEEQNIVEVDSHRTKFASRFGRGTEITCDADLVFEYARKVKEFKGDEPLTIIVVLNSGKYAGTTYLYGNGSSIALCPMSREVSPNDFEGLIHHEAGGHGFGFLCDEYVYYQTAIPESRKRDLKEWQRLGFQMNLDFTNNPDSILWKDFIGLEKYSCAGCYEGGYEYQYGVWRSETNSCMNNNIPYFNVQSRWSIVNRIMQLSNKAFNIQDFIEKDVAVCPKENDSRSIKEFIPLAPPVWKIK